MPAGGASSFVLAVLTPVGTIFVNLIRMTVIPLVMSLLIATLGGASASRGLGRTGGRGRCSFPHAHLRWRRWPAA